MPRWSSPAFLNWILPLFRSKKAAGGALRRCHRSRLRLECLEERNLLATAPLGNGSSQLFNDGFISLNTPAVGTIGVAGEQDQWTFYGQAGELVTVTANPGSTAVPALPSPMLNEVSVQVVGPNGTVVAAGNSASAGGVVTLSNLNLPTDGTYSIQISAAPGYAANLGSYQVAVWDATTYVAPVLLNNPTTGVLTSPYATDDWTFSANAGAQIQFHLINEASSATQFTLIGPGGYVGFTDLTSNSSLLTLPTSGTYALEVNSNGVAAGGYAFDLQQTSETVLTLGTPYQGTLSGSGQAQLFLVNATGGQPLQVDLHDNSNADQDQLYANFSAPPTLTNYQYQATTGANGDQQILIQDAYPGTWYVLLYTSSVPTTSSYTITATENSVFLTSMTPTTSTTGGDTILTLTGAGFLLGSQVNLIAGNGTTYAVPNCTVDSPTQLTATLAAGSVPAGTYSVSVSETNGSVATLPGFTMTSTGEGNLTASVSAPGTVAPNTYGIVYVDYANTGTAPMPAPLFVLQSGTSGALMTLDASQYTSGDLADFSSSVQLLGSGATPGVLQPGESMSVPVYVFFPGSATFQLGVVEADNTTPINWSTLEADTQPADISSTAWSVIFATLQADTGATYGDYVQELDANAQYLGSLGENVTDVSQLYNFEIQQADGLNPISQLNAAVDAEVQTPGLSLSFERFFSSSISGRYQKGPFGLGWSDSWQTSLSVQPAGTVIVTEPGGSERVFQPDSNDSSLYFDQPGDYGVLTPTGGGTFTLTEQDGTITAFNANGTLNYEQDADGNRITASYTNGLLTILTDSNGAFLQIAYNSAGLITSITDSLGRQTTYTYDATNQYLLSVTTFDDQTTSYTYSSGGGAATNNALLSITNPDDTHEYFTYDAEGRLTSTYQDGGAEKITYSYGPGGTVAATDADGNTTIYYFNNYGLIAKEQDPLGGVFQYIYNSNDELTEIVNPDDQITTYQYDANGDLLSTTDPLGDRTSYTYSTTDDLLASITDADGNTTQYTYNGQGNLTSTIYADGTIESLAYDPVGNVISSTDPDGQVTQYTYNSSGQVLTQTYANGSTTTFTYDPSGNLTSVTDATGTTTLTYDAEDRLIQITYPNGQYLKYTYNAAGQRTQMVDQSGFTVNYTYDDDGRLSELTDGSGNLIVEYTYDAAGNLIRKDMGNGTYTTYTYNAADEVVSLVNYAPGGSVNSEFDYTYNDLGLETSEETVNGTWTYSYNARGQLSQAVFVSSNPSLSSQDLVYNYDAVGHLTSTVINGILTPYTTNDRNEYTSIGGTTYSYDADGNLISQTNANGITTTYTYNALNQLVGVNSPALSASYTYNAFGNEVSQTVNGTTTNYLIDPTGSGNVAASYTGTGSLIADYTYGLGLVSQVNAASGTAYYDFDASGNTAGLTDAAGQYVNQYSYSPFDQTTTLAAALPNPFTVAGQWGVLDGGIGMGPMGLGTGNVLTGPLTQNDSLGLPGGNGNAIPSGDDALSNSVEPTIATAVEQLQQTPTTTTTQPNVDVPIPSVILPGLPSAVVTLESVAQTVALSSSDLDSLTGPLGYGSANFVAANAPLLYRIDFENAPTATAPVQRAVVTEQLDSGLNWNTFQFTALGFGDTTLLVPSGSQQYQTTVSMTYDSQTFDVQIGAAFNSTTGLLTVTFQSIDPNTDLPPSLLIGFLPPENGTGQGEGYVSYLVQPKSNLPADTPITSVAFITFDGNQSIATDQVNDADISQGIDPTKQALVTIDSTPPTSTVSALPAFSPSTFTVSWSGQDNPGGPGIATYDVYVSDNGAAFTPLLLNTTQTSTTFTGQNGHTYRFYSIATDNVGNQQATPTTAQATTTVDAVAPAVASVTSTTPGGTYGTGATINVTVTFNTVVTLAGGTLTIQLNDGGVVTLAPFTNATTVSGTYTVAAGQNTAALDSTALTLSTGATITDALGNQVNLAIPVGHSLANSDSLAVNTMPPPPPPVPPPPAGQPPVISSIAPQTVTDGSSLSVMVTATVPNGTGASVPLTFSLGVGAPPGASINASTGLFAWTPSEWTGVAPGVYQVAVTVTETNAPHLSSSVVFTVTVGPSSTNQGSGIIGRTTVAFGLTLSAEYDTDFITAAYEKYLGRAPDANGLAYWLNLMQNQGLSEESLDAGFIGSQEYINDHGGVGAGWIIGMYVSLLGRSPALSEVQYWLNQLAAGMSTADIAYSFVTSPEHEGDVVAADYEQYLGRSASASEIQYWINVFENGGSNEQVIAGFISSQEFFQEHGNNIVDWLFASYRAVLQRLPDVDGYQYWLNQLE